MGTPQAFQQNNALPSDNSSATLSRSPTASAQRVEQDIHRHSHANTPSAPFQSQWPSCFSDHPTSIPPRSLRERDSYNFSEGTSVGEQSSSATASNYHHHWCWVCPDYISIKACGGFKRHIGEHFTRYYCIPPETVISTENGQRCALCGFSDPDPRHLNEHSRPGCVDKSYKRKEGLINHHIDKHPELGDTSILANLSKYTKKKHFACGICVFYCTSPEELANHVDAVHYKSLEFFPNWDCNKVMLGLLSQPRLSDLWRTARAAYPLVQESWFTWDSTQVKQLQNDLEEGRKPPADLVTAAIDQSKYGRSKYDHVESMALSSFTGPIIDNSQSIQGLQHQNALSTLPSTSEQGISTHTPRMIAPVLPSQKWDADLEEWHSPPIASENNGSPFHAMYHQPGHRPQPRAFVNSLEGQRRNPYSSNLRGHSQGVSTNPTTLPSSRRMAEAHNYSARPQTGWSHSSFQSAPSQLPQNSLTSLRGQLTSHYNPRHTPHLSTQRRHQETIDYRETSIDADSDNTQRFMQDKNHTRAQR